MLKNISGPIKLVQLCVILPLKGTNQREESLRGTMYIHNLEKMDFVIMIVMNLLICKAVKRKKRHGKTRECSLKQDHTDNKA